MHWDKLVIASHNNGKLNEFRALFEPLKINIIPQAELGVGDIEETGSTFVENALLKARHAASLTGLPALADDSGLVVPALGGAPGIRSARFAGSPSNAQANIDKLLLAMKGLPREKRGAYFYCVIVLLTHAEDPSPVICEGRWKGEIIEKAQGDGGFGYDPVFYSPETQQTAAQLPMDVKNNISHRGQALRLLLKQL